MSADSIIPEAPSLRLANGSNRCAGRVEVLHQEEWGAVCGHGWDEPEDKVVCRQLGCGTAMPALEGADFGAGPSRVWLDNVKCQGTERDLRECWASVWGESRCEHGRHASVVCSGASHSGGAAVRGHRQFLAIPAGSKVLGPGPLNPSRSPSRPGGEAAGSEVRSPCSTGPDAGSFLLPRSSRVL